MKSQVIREKMKQFSYRGKVVKLTVLIAMVMVLAVITGALYFKSSVYITDNNITKEIKTNETELYSILNDAGIELYDGDITTLRSDSNDTIYIDIVRAFDVTVIADKKTYTLRMTEGTVADAVKAAGVVVGEDDIVSEELDGELYEGIEIKVSRVKFSERTTDVEIPFGTDYVDSSNLRIGTEIVAFRGKEGVKTYHYRDMYIDGEYVSSVKIGEEISKEPENKVITRGTALNVPYAKLGDESKVTLVNGLPENYVKVVSGKATAYSAPAGSLTASGRYAVVGTVAVNPKVIPYGSEVYIVSQDRSRVYGYAIAADTGGAMLSGVAAVDLFMSSYQDCCNWGVVYVDIYVLSVGDNKYVRVR